MWLNATDPDDDSLEFGVEGEYHNKLISVKKVTKTHAIVFGKQVFDREVNDFLIFVKTYFIWKFILKRSKKSMRT